MINLIDSALKRVSIRLLRQKKSWKNSLKSILNVPKKNVLCLYKDILTRNERRNVGAHFMYLC